VTGLVFVDTETTGLLPFHHEVWEIAVIERKVIEHETQPTQTVDVEHVFHVKPDLTKADPTALRICRYYERAGEMDRAPRAMGMLDGQTYLDDTPRSGLRWQEPTRVAMSLARLLDGKHIVGAVPSFDAAFLSRFLHRLGQAATWHYHLIDVEALAIGHMAGRFTTLQRNAEVLNTTCQPGPYAPQLPWPSDVLTQAMGVTIAEEDKHTALGDARWARDLYDAVMSGSGFTGGA
jgi:hypothetical protein